jgi:hypothetical protein
MYNGIIDGSLVIFTKPNLKMNVVKYGLELVYSNKTIGFHCIDFYENDS